MAATKKLRTVVHLTDDAGRLHTFGPESDEIPAWARKRIDNPDAWDDGPEQGDQLSTLPGDRASREEWADYARHRGASDDETRPGGLSKADLKARYSPPEPA